MEVKFIKKPVSLFMKDEPKRTVEGYYFQFEGLELNAHKNVNGPGWTVTEVKTGLSTSARGTTRKEAVERFGQLFTKYGKEFFLKAIDLAIKKGVA